MFRKIIAYLLFIGSLLFALVFFVVEGFTIKSLSLPGIEITQLYIKLDKKLILEAEEIIIRKQSNVNNSLENIQKDIKKLPIYLNYFQTIHIEKLQIDGNEFVIEINDNILFIDNKFINIAAKPIFEKRKITLDLYSMYLKDVNLLLEGKVIIDYNNIKMLFNGSYSRNDLSGTLVFKADDRFLDFSLDSNDIKNIHFVKEFVTLNPIIEKWMYDNVLGTYKLDNFEGRISTKNFQPILTSFKANAKVTGAKIRFHDDVDYVNTKQVSVKFENDNLSFDLEKPTYKNIDIDGSNVIIYNITGANSNIDVNLATKHRLSQEILDIIKAYGPTVPIRQLDGDTDSKLTINVDFDTSDVSITGDFTAKKANFKIKELTFLATNAKVSLRDNIVWIKDTQVDYKDNLDALLDLKINTSDSSALGNAHLKTLDIKSDERSILHLKDKKTNVEVDFTKDVTISFDTLETSININDKSIDIDLKNLDTVYSDSKLLQELGVNYGELFLSLYTLEDIYFKADLYKLDLPLKKDDEFITSLNIEGTIVGDRVDVKTMDDSIAVLMMKDLIDLEINNTDVVFDVKNSAVNKIDNNIKLLFNNANITLDNNDSFDVDNFNILKNKNGLTLNGDVLNLDLPILKNGKKLRNVSIQGNYNNNILDIKSKNNDLKLKIDEKEQLSIYVKDMDITYDTNATKGLNDKNIVLEGDNSSIIVNSKYKLLSNKYTFVLKDKVIAFDSAYKGGLIKYTQDKNGLKGVKGINLNSELVDNFLNNDLVKGGKIDFTASGYDNNITGKINFKDNKIANLAFLNNLILFLNTSPILINPLFALPAAIDIATNKGISVDGYHINKGYVDFVYDFDADIFNAKKIDTKGSIVDFDGNAVLNFKDSTINSTINVAFLKSYTNIVKEIPIVGYIFLGDDKKVATRVEISGNLDKPEYKTNLVKDSANVPLNFIKRIIKLPKKALESITK